MFISFLIALSTFTTGVWEHSETVTVLLCASVLGRHCIVLQSRRLPRFTEKKLFLDFENQALHGFTKENTATFCKKKPLHGFK